MVLSKKDERRKKLNADERADREWNETLL